MKSTSSGFTLIELIVVITIIGFLSTFVLTNLGESRKRTRDQVRVSAMIQLRTALQNRFASVGTFPIQSADWGSSDPLDNVTGPKGGNTWIPGLTSATTISALPADPTGGDPTNFGAYPACTGSKRAFRYRSDATGSEYVLLSRCAWESSSSNIGFKATSTPYILKICSNPTSALCTGAL
jgi:prepilin-type N-terminal cleavage/methylation domain-containing protein